MTFTELFGTMEKLALLDFLGDHPNFAYTLEEIQEYWTSLLRNISPLRAVDELVEYGLIKIVDTKYQLNTEHEIVKSVLRWDILKANEEANKLSSEGK